MAISLTHTTTADATFSTDGADAWNEAHTLTMATARMLGRTTASAGAVEEISVGSGLTLSAGTLDLTVPMDLAGGTVTTSNPVIDMTQTWNAGAQTFTGVKLNVTKTAAAANSKLINFSASTGETFDFYTSVGSAGAGFAFGSTNGGSNRMPMFRQIAAAGISYELSTTDSDLPVIQWAINQQRAAFPSDIAIGRTLALVDTFLSRNGAANLQLGAADAAAPVAQTLSVQSVVAGTSNTAGTDFSIYGSKSTGTGAGGSIKFYTSPAGSTGTAQNAGVLALTIDSTKKATFAGDIALGGVTFLENNGLQFQRSGTNIFYIVSGNSEVRMPSGYGFGWSSSSTGALGIDTILARDAANTLALRNGTNSQTFHVYETYTDTSNYSRLKVGAYSGGYFEIGSANLGTSGTQRGIFIQGGSIAFGIATAPKWDINSSGHFLARTDNSVDIGASGATRPRNIYVGTSVVVPGGATAVLKSAAAITSGAGAGAGTLTNAPAAGDPTKWIPIDDNGTTRYIPAW